MILTDEEKNKIIEEEKLRIKIRLKYEQKSSGLAGILSTICPGLGQIYNGQLGKAIFFALIVLISIVLFSFGITFWLKSIPYKVGKINVIEQEKPLEITEEGVVIEKGGEKSKDILENKSKIPYIFIILGLIGLCYGWNYAVKDAIKTAKRLNEEALKDL